MWVSLSYLIKVWLFFLKMNTKLQRKLMLPKYISKIKIACSCINFLSLYYEPWHIRNQGIFIIWGIFRTLEYSKLRQYLHYCKTYCNIFRKWFQAIIIFSKRSFLYHFRCLAAGFWIPLCIYKCDITCKLILGFVSCIFKHI